MLSMTRSALPLAALLACIPAPAWAADTEELAEIVVLGSRQRLDATPGSGALLDAATLERSRVFTVNEALRKVPGLVARDEEGLGLRPNIGIRGLNPTRSSKVLLLEDGLPLTFAPYGDNASYYHPPIERFERIEIQKGAGQIAFGPQTVGGVINYITRAAPQEFEGALLLRAGNRGFRDVQARVGDSIDATGTRWIGSFTRKDSDGTRDNTALLIEDASLRVEQPLGENRSLVVRSSLYREDSQVSYSGLTLAEYLADPRGNPFEDDRFTMQRAAVSATLGEQFDNGAKLRTSAYYTYLNRDWWRQASNSGQRPADSADPGCAGLANLRNGCGNEGRLRQYYTAGIESRWNHSLPLGRFANEVSSGVRYHVEKQNRVQVNGDRADSRTPGVSVNAGIREDNRRDVAATSAFISTSFGTERWRIEPGLRFEHIEFERRNALTGGAGGRTTLNEWIPGIGTTLRLDRGLTLFAGIHRGFAPPRVEDVIGPSGGSVELEAERSWNSEIGLRAEPFAGARFELAAFDMDFSNQIVPASVAGGTGATLTSAGRTRHRGLEFSGQFDSQAALDTRTNLYARAALTWLADAQYRGTRFSTVPGFGTVSVSGHRLPYAPEHLATLGFGIEMPRGFSAELEATYTSHAFGDDLNTVAITANGQRGRIGGHALLNATVAQQIGAASAVFISAKNVADRRYIADLSRGLLPGTPRQIHIGFDWRF